MQEKRIFWQYEIEGERDIVTEVEKMILETADEYKQQAETTNKAVKTVIHRYVDILFVKSLTRCKLNHISLSASTNGPNT